VSEMPGIRVTQEAVSMLRTRYAFASPFCEGKDVLELACGAGMGLAYLSRYARRLVGGDYTESMLQIAKRESLPDVPLIRLDAQELPFKENTFDVVLLFEAIYYLPHPDAFLQECHRILRKTGTLVLCSANKEYPGFGASDLSSRYYSARELRELLEENNFQCEIYGGFHAAAKSPTGKVKELVREFAARLNLIPKTMRGKEFLKSVFYGGLVELRPSIEEHTAPYDPPVLLEPQKQGASGYKVVYLVGRAGRISTTRDLVTTIRGQDRTPC
jgi:ubiquinone/menaquinone biosynthesis C-methylase UbiE